MANKRKKRKRPYTPPAPRAGVVTAPEAEAAAPKAPPARRQNKEEARRARERALRQLRRREALRRAFTVVTIAVVVGALFFFLTRVGKPGLSEETVTAAKAAGCSSLQEQTDEGGGHDQPYTYTEQPATSGRHDPSPLVGGIYTEPQAEAQVVHAMEHGYVVIYYLADGDNAVSDDVLTALENAAEDEEQVILAPYAELPAGTTVAYAAWNYLMTCPGSVTPAQVPTITAGFIDALRDADTAPEKSVD
ncbi:MAG: DUF3105 domain-containing protein [Actinobacteria bacterium]|nr:DUF3105 domain-containing protein [Actinomycetota bacterium]